MNRRNFLRVAIGSVLAAIIPGQLCYRNVDSHVVDLGKLDMSQVSGITITSYDTSWWVEYDYSQLYETDPLKDSLTGDYTYEMWFDQGKTIRDRNLPTLYWY